MDHCAVGNVETFANLLEMGEFVIVFILEQSLNHLRNVSRMFLLIQKLCL